VFRRCSDSASLKRRLLSTEKSLSSHRQQVRGRFAITGYTIRLILQSLSSEDLTVPLILLVVAIGFAGLVIIYLYGRGKIK